MRKADLTGNPDFKELERFESEPIVYSTDEHELAGALIELSSRYKHTSESERSAYNALIEKSLI